MCTALMKRGPLARLRWSATMTTMRGQTRAGNPRTGSKNSPTACAWARREPVRIRRELREVTPPEESHEPRPAHNVLHGSRSRARPRNLHRGRLSAGQAGPVDGRARGLTFSNFAPTEKVGTN